MTAGDSKAHETTDASGGGGSGPDANPHFDHVDRVYAWVRVGALISGLLYALVAAANVRTDLLIAFAIFSTYSVIVYVGGWTLFATHRKGRFYWTTGALDFLFIVVLIHMTGGGAGPMYRALYLWVAMAAFYSGTRGGNAASAVAFVAFLWFFALDDAGRDLWSLGVKSGGLLLHGPIIGYMVDRDRRYKRELLEARQKLEELGS